LTYLEGGITREQFETLLTEFTEIDNQNLKFHAAINGVDLDEESDSEPAAKAENEISNSTVPMFGDPDAYSQCDENEKEEMTKKMLDKHKLWASDMKVK